MKQCIIYTLGCMIMAPAFLLAFSGDVLLTIFGLLYGAAVYAHSVKTRAGKRFWLRWHLANGRIIRLWLH